MRLITIFLAVLLLLIQPPLWLGKGGWLHVWDMEKQVAAAQQKNADLIARNAKLESEVLDLKEGTGAVEERARYELGMIKSDEIFVQVLAPNCKIAHPAKKRIGITERPEAGALAAYFPGSVLNALHP